jgi:hypothetical protein
MLFLAARGVLQSERRSNGSGWGCGMSRNVVVLLNSEDGRALVRKRCKQARIPVRILEELITCEIEQQGKMRKAGLWDEFDRVFDGLAEDEGGAA